MFEFLFKKREQETARDVELNKVYEELKKLIQATIFQKSGRSICLCIYRNTVI